MTNSERSDFTGRSSHRCRPPAALPRAKTGLLWGEVCFVLMDMQHVYMWRWPCCSGCPQHCFFFVNMTDGLQTSVFVILTHLHVSHVCTSFWMCKTNLSTGAIIMFIYLFILNLIKQVKKGKVVFSLNSDPHDGSQWIPCRPSSRVACDSDLKVSPTGVWPPSLKPFSLFFFSYLTRSSLVG